MSKEQNKFKHILLVPNVVSDKTFLKRHKTFQTFVKKAHSDLYYLQLKKIGGLNKKIAEKADYGQVIQQIKTNRLQNEYLNQQKKSQGFMYNNQLWSDKYYNQVFQMARLAQLSNVLSKQKLKTRDDLIQDFEEYFKKFAPQDSDQFTEFQKALPTSNCTTKCSSRIASQHNNLRTAIPEIPRTKSHQPSFQDKLYTIIDEANILHNQNLDVIKQKDNQNRKVKTFSNEQFRLKERVYESLEERNNFRKLQTSLRSRQIHFRNKFVRERLEKDLEDLFYNQNI